MRSSLEACFRDTVFIAHSLFDRGKTTGSTANISFRHEGRIYISRTGSCFATLTAEDFAVVEDRPGSIAVLSESQPSKELPLHRQLYERHAEIGAVIHTHGFYATLWSCLPHGDPDDVMPSYTPYLAMKVGKVRLVPYGSPGSNALFAHFAKRLDEGWAYLLANHGSVVGGKDPMDAFFRLEELEESARVAWHLRHAADAVRIS